MKAEADIPARAQAEDWQAVSYIPGRKDEWDAFVRTARNATFLHLRGYMDYHAQRFRDASLMLYRGGRLRALLPANMDGTCCHSHAGLTYGGLLMSPGLTYREAEAALREALRTWHGMGADMLVYRAVPAIYHRQPAEEDLYALWRMGARFSARGLSSVVRLNGKAPVFRTLRCRQAKRAQTAGVQITEDEDFAAFWPVLEENLMNAHGVRPVHSLDEICLLHARFPQNIRLFRACLEGDTVAGCVVYETDTVAHVQYISASAEGRRLGALDLLFTRLIQSRYLAKPWFDFGLCTEQGGRLLNEGLLFQKEGFGARAVAYDTYELKLDSMI